MTWKKIWSKKHSVRVAECWVLSTKQFRKVFSTPFPDQLIVITNEMGAGYLDEKQLHSCLASILRNIYKNSFYTYYEQRAMPVLHNFLANSKKISRLPLRTYSRQKLHKLWQAFIQKEAEWMNYLWFIFLLDEPLTKELAMQLKKRMGAGVDLERFFQTVLSQVKKTAVYTQKIELLRLATKARALTRGQLDTALAKLTDKYAYFPIYNMDERPLPNSYFKIELRKILKQPKGYPLAELKKLQAITRGNEQNYKKLLRQFRNDKKFTTLLDACRKVSYYREYRNDLRQQSYYYSRALYIEIARRMNLTINDVIFLTRQEINDFLLKGTLQAPTNSIKSRKRLFALQKQGRDVRYISDPKLSKSLIPKNTPVPSGMIKGVIAYPGKITGKVCVILNAQKQGNKMRQGDILVTTTTNLNFIPLIAKAAGIITEEGGLLTHAAIVARELKKPCVVGTKIATKVLKDGDVIELDADAGTIKKLH